MGQVMDRRYLLLQKFIKLRDQYGHDHACAQFTQAEHDDMFNYIVACATPANYDKAEANGAQPGSYAISPNLL